VAPLEGGDLVKLAARNNAEWCDIVCRAHGVMGAFYPDVWASARRTPPLYPDAVALNRSLAAEQVLEYVDDSAGCSVKDSYGVMDLTAAGFRVLFEAEWIHRSPRPTPKARNAQLSWKHVRDAETLKSWEAAWAGGAVASRLFLPALLSLPDVVVIGGYIKHRLIAGGVLNRNGATVGLSNVFIATGDLYDAYEGCVAAAVERFPGLSIVGYESGDALKVAGAQGFRSVGRLLVWLKDDESNSTGHN
jgi:hypothetical protein